MKHLNKKYFEKYGKGKIEEGKVRVRPAASVIHFGSDREKMDIKSLKATDGHQERERQAFNFLEKLIKRNATENGIADADHIEKNLRDAKQFQKIMEKFKIDEADNLIESSLKDGQYRRRGGRRHSARNPLIY